MVPRFATAPVLASARALKLRAVLLIIVLLLVPTFSHADWKVKTISKGGAYNSIAVDPSGNPHISYLDDSNPRDYVLRHASLNGKSWHSEIVDSGDVGWWNAIAVDSLGHIHISYLADKPTSSLRYAHFDGAGWSVTTVDSTGGYSTSIAVDVDNRPHISYVDFSGNLKYATFDGATWHKEALPDVSALWFGRTSIAMAPSGAINITFSTMNRQIQWATNASGPWEVRTVGDGIQPSWLWTVPATHISFLIPRRPGISSIPAMTGATGRIRTSPNSKVKVQGRSRTLRSIPRVGPMSQRECMCLLERVEWRS